MAHDDATPPRGWHWEGQALLFDLDGTLVDSTASVLRAWRASAASIGVPFAELEPYIHGIPAPQAFALALPDASAQDMRRWSDQLLAQQVEDTDDVIAIEGAIALLDRVPATRWAIVTSGNRALARARITAAGLPLPRVLVTADDVVSGKPDPAPYLMGASRLSVPPHGCLVFEDAWPGVQSAVSAGMPVVGVLTSSQLLHDVGHLITDFTELDFDVDRFGVRVGSPH